MNSHLIWIGLEVTAVCLIAVAIASGYWPA